MLEIEHRYRTYDKEALSKALRMQRRKPKVFLLKQWLFKHPSYPYYIRLREMGDQTFLTVKKPRVGEFEDEYETVVADREAMAAILVLFGCRQTFYIEKIREVWSFRDYEIVFDMYPGLPELMEMEAKDVATLKRIEGRLGLVPESFGTEALYQQLYGILAKAHGDRIDFQSAETWKPIRDVAAFAERLAAQRKRVKEIRR